MTSTRDHTYTVTNAHSLAEKYLCWVWWMSLTQVFSSFIPLLLKIYLSPPNSLMVSQLDLLRFQSLFGSPALNLAWSFSLPLLISAIFICSLIGRNWSWYAGLDLCSIARSESKVWVVSNLVGQKQKEEIEEKRKRRKNIPWLPSRGSNSYLSYMNRFSLQPPIK